MEVLEKSPRINVTTFLGQIHGWSALCYVTKAFFTRKIKE